MGEKSQPNGKLPGENLERYALESPHIIRPEKQLDAICKFLSPEVAIEYVNKVHYSMQTSQQKLSFFAQAYQPSAVETYVVVEGAKAEEILSNKAQERCVLFG